uniref:Uncharacterized protein n=1 Tax=Arundo donax TaxID=35708 RepID=A0A0A9C8R0_ARUDO
MILEYRLPEFIEFVTVSSKALSSYYYINQNENTGGKTALPICEWQNGH